MGERRDMIYQYQAGQSFFHGIDPITKFGWLIGVSLLALLFDTGLTQLILLTVIMIMGRTLAGLTWHEMWRGMRIPFWFGLPYFFLQLIFLPGESVLFQIGSFDLTIEAIDYAAAITLRFVALVLASLLYIISTDPRHVVLALAQKLKVPYRFAFAISIALRFLPILEAEAATIQSAQRMRGLSMPTGWIDKFYWWKSFVIAIFIHAVRRVGQIADGMDMKGFGAYPDRTYVHTLEVTKKGIVFVAISGLITLLAIIIWYLY